MCDEHVLINLHAKDKGYYSLVCKRFRPSGTDSKCYAVVCPTYIEKILIDHLAQSIDHLV